ncbi:MAG: biotin/lipoyl-containing protein [Bdellovibrionota bacterium]
MTKYLVTVNGSPHEVNLLSKHGNTLAFEVQGEAFTSKIEPMISFSSANTANLIAGSAAQPSSNPIQTDGNIRAPMPGIIVSIAVKAGDEVKIGDIVLVMEAMKMENNITAPSAGTGSVRVKNGMR